LRRVGAQPQDGPVRSVYDSRVCQILSCSKQMTINTYQVTQYTFPILQRIFSATMATMQPDNSFIVVGPVALGAHLLCDKLTHYMRDIKLRPTCIDLCVKKGTGKEVAKCLVDKLRISMVKYGVYTAFTHMLEFTLQAVQPGSSGMMSLPTWETNKGIEMTEISDTIYINIHTQVNNVSQFLPFVTVVECDDNEWDGVQKTLKHMWPINANVVSLEYLKDQDGVTSLKHKTIDHYKFALEEYNKGPRVDPVVSCLFLISDKESYNDFDFKLASDNSAEELSKTQLIKYVNTYSKNSVRFNSAYLRAAFDKNYDPTNDGKGVFEDKSLSFGGLHEGLLSAVSQVESINKDHAEFMVYRGVDYFQLFDERKRDIFMMDKFKIPNFTFSSTSIDPRVAIGFAKEDSICCLLVLLVPTEYTRYVAMGNDNLSEYSDEAEVLFPDDAVFNIEKCTYKIIKGKGSPKKLLELRGKVVNSINNPRGGGVSRNLGVRRIKGTKKRGGGVNEQLHLIDLSLLNDRQEQRQCCGLSPSQEEALIRVFTGSPPRIPTWIHGIPKEPWQIEKTGQIGQIGHRDHPVLVGSGGCPTYDARRIQLYAKTVTQLRNVAREKGGIRGFSRMRKEELINALWGCAPRHTKRRKGTRPP